MNSFLNTLELRFGRFAIPGLVAILASLQAATWVILRFVQPEFATSLFLFRPAVEAGEWWRLFTWVLVPESDRIIWVLIATMLMLTFSAVLDQAWGAFRVNLYIFGGMLCVVLGHWFFSPLPITLGLYSSIFLAFCVVVPNYELNLYFLIPIKVKYLAFIDAGYYIFTFIDTPPLRSAIFFSHLNFFIAFTPVFIGWLMQRGTTMERRARFESAKPVEGDHFHKCASCGKTDLDDPKLDFRVTADGEEYCSVCRPGKTLAEQS